MNTALQDTTQRRGFPPKTKADMRMLLSRVIRGGTYLARWSRLSAIRRGTSVLRDKRTQVSEFKQAESSLFQELIHRFTVGLGNFGHPRP